jgi:Ca-activated chloride channel family protein
VICATALILLLDVSGSVGARDWELQRDGHAAAFEAEQIARVIEREPLAVKAIAFADTADSLVTWRLLRTAADAASFAAELRQAPRPWSGGTHIGHALETALAAFPDAPCDAESRVIDLVTDADASPIPVQAVRQQAEAEGVRINALGVGPDTAAAWLREHAVTMGGFVMHAESWGDFARAVLRKVTLEVAGR